MSGKVVIPLFDAFDIETYDGLLGFIETHLELDAETTAQLPTLIRLAEYEMDRVLTAPQREYSVSLATTAGVGFVALPLHYRQPKTVKIEGYSPTLDATSLAEVQADQCDSGRPKSYAIAEEAIHFGPKPDAAYTVFLTYMTRIPPLSPTNQTNWLLSQHADAYVFSVLIQTLLFVNDDDRAASLRPHFVTIMGQINSQGDRYRFGARMTPKVVGLP